MLAWDAESGTPLTPIVTWQDKRSQEVLDRLEADGPRRGRDGAKRHAARPLLLGREARPGCSSTTSRCSGPPTPGRCGSAPSTPGSATASAPASPPTPRPPREPSSARPSGIDGPARRSSASRARRSPRSPTPPATSARCATTPGRPSCRCAPAASTSRRRWPARAACCPGWSRRPTAPASSSSPTPATSGPRSTGGLLPTVAWRVDGRVEWAIDGGVFTAGALLEWMSRDLGLAEDPPALAALAATVEDSGGVRVLPALPGVGAPWWRPEARAVIAGLTAARPAPATSPAPRSRRSRGGSPTSSPPSARAVPAEALRVDGGLTRDPTLLQLAGRLHPDPGRAGRRRRHRRRGGGARRGRRRDLGIDRGDRRAHPGRRAASSPSATTPGASASTRPGASSCERRPNCERGLTPRPRGVRPRKGQAFDLSPTGSDRRACGGR